MKVLLLLLLLLHDRSITAGTVWKLSGSELTSQSSAIVKTRLLQMMTSGNKDNLMSLINAGIVFCVFPIRKIVLLLAEVV